MKDAEEHKFTWIGRLYLLFLSNANAFRKQGGAIFADWEALSRCEVWMKKSAANMAKGICHEYFRLNQWTLIGKNIYFNNLRETQSWRYNLQIR